MPEPISPEPWNVGSEDTCLVYEGDNGVASCEYTEDANRIVACVNFCAGLPTEKLISHTKQLSDRCLEHDMHRQWRTIIDTLVPSDGKPGERFLSHQIVITAHRKDEQEVSGQEDE